MTKLTRLVIDFSVFISNLTETEEHTVQSRRFFAGLQLVELMIPALVIVEVTVNLKKHGWSDVTQIKKIFSNFIVLGMDEKTVYELLALWEKNTLKSSDFIVAATAKIHDAILVTWDKKLLENTICQVMTPADFLKLT